MWIAPVPIFEDEDEDELINEFVKAAARFHKYDFLTICRHVFKDRKDPESRALQASITWPKDLAILERIDAARLNGGVEPDKPDTKEERLRKLKALYDDPDTPIKEKIAAIELAAKIAGEIVKPIEKTINQGRGFVPQIIQAPYPE